MSASLRTEAQSLASRETKLEIEHRLWAQIVRAIDSTPTRKEIFCISLRREVVQITTKAENMVRAGEGAEAS